MPAHLKKLVRALVLASVAVYGGNAAADAPAQPEVQVPSGSAPYRHGTRVALDAAGNGIAIWQNADSLSRNSSYEGTIGGQCLAPDGTARPGQIFIDDVASGRPAMAADAAGNFVVIWLRAQTTSPGASRGDLVGQRFDASCQPLGARFVVNQGSDTRNIRTTSLGVSMNATGSFVVSWSEVNLISITAFNNLLTYSIHARRYPVGARAPGLDLVVNTQTEYTGNLFPSEGYLGSVDVAINDSGAFVLTWIRSDANGGFLIYARRYAASGLAAGAAFQVSGIGSVVEQPAPGTSRTTYFSKHDPKVAIDGSGSFLIAYDGATVDNQQGIFARRYNGAGVALTREFRVTGPERSYAFGAAVAMDASGQAVVAWTLSPAVTPFGEVPVGNVFAQRFDSAGIENGPTFKIDTTSGNRLAEIAVARNGSGRILFSWTAVDENVEDFGGPSGEIYTARCCTP